ncbi:MAG: RNA-binding S4 domain-containing protein [Lachnospiraceae bacterium]|nr:RNA-binding S4 domain-containing protein [Lachnospiraceae bacterium]
MQEIKIRDEYIKLCQLLKLAGLVDSGAQAKEEILALKVKVNGEADERIRRKVYAGDVVEYEGNSVKIVN